MTIEIDNNAHTVTMSTEDYFFLSTKAQKNTSLELAAIYAWMLLHPQGIREDLIPIIEDDFSHHTSHLFSELALLKVA